MAPLSFPAPQRKDEDDIEVVNDEIQILDEIVIVEDTAPGERQIGPDLTLRTEPEQDSPGPHKSTTTPDRPGSLRALFGPEMTAGISVTILFVIFAIVLAAGSPDQTPEGDENPVAPVEEITVEIGEGVSLERGE